MGNIIYTFPESRTSNGLLQWSNSHLFGPVVILKCFDTAVKFFTASFIKNLIWWVFFVHMNQPTNKWNLETKSDFMLGSNIRISPTLQANNNRTTTSGRVRVLLQCFCGSEMILHHIYICTSILVFPLHVLQQIIENSVESSVFSITSPGGAAQSTAANRVQGNIKKLNNKIIFALITL